MKFARLLFIIAFLIGGAAGSGCNRKVSMQSEKSLTKNMMDLEKLSGLKLPASSRVLSANDESGHDGTKYKRWIIQSSERPLLLGEAIDGDENQTFVKTLEEAMPEEKIGKPVGGKYQFSDWKNEQGEWQAAAVETDKGFYLSLENIVLD